MLSRLYYEHSPLPVYDSEQGQKLARLLHDTYSDWRDRSQELRTKIWPACDRAFLGLRKLPKAPGFHWIDKGDLGETDLWDAVRMIVEGMLLSLMPRDMSWLSVVPYEAEEQGISNTIRDYLIAKHRVGGTRDNFGKHLTQTFVRGTGAIHWRWEQIAGYRRKGIAEKLLAEIQPQADMAREQLGELFNLDPGDIDPVDLLPPDLLSAIDQQDREPFLQFDGPVVRALDMQDVFLDPNSNSAQDVDVPMCVMQYMTLEQLHGSVDENNQPVYGNLEELTAKSMDEIYGSLEGRGNSAKYLGVGGTEMHNRGTKYVPVLVFHRQLQVMEKDKWVDTYFYVAMNQSGGPRLIRAHENPSNTGRRSVFIDTFHDHYSGCAYGVSGIEKSLPAYNQKCVLAALTLNAQVASVFPAYNIVADMIVDERKPVIAPGQFNFVTYKPQLGPNFIAPVPVPSSGALLGMQAQQFLGQKILGQTGAVGGALGLDPSRNIEQSKTATQIDTESSSSSIGRDNLLEKISVGSLEPICQAIYEAAYQYASEDIIRFVTETGGEAVMQSLNKSQLSGKRQIIVTGYHGLQQKNKEIQDLTKALQVIGQGNGMQYLGAGGPLLLREIMLRLLGRFGLKDLDKYRQPDIELMAQTPGGQQVLQEVSMQSVQQVLQLLEVPPEVANNVVQMFARPPQQQQGQGGMAQAA